MANSIRRRDVLSLASGAATLPIAWPLAARAQQRKMPVIGYLRGGGGFGVPRLTDAFRHGLGELGYVEGRNVEILYYSAEYRNDRLPVLAADLARRQVAVIFATGGTELAAQAATATIPIVFSGGSDPVKLGLVASLNRPGGNATGVTFLSQQLTAKRLELLHEVVPAVTSIGHLNNPTSPVGENEIREAEAAARTLGVHLTTLNAGTPREIEVAFAMLPGKRIGALIVSIDPLFFVEARSARRVGGPPQGARDPLFARVRRCRRSDELRAECF